MFSCIAPKQNEISVDIGGEMTLLQYVSRRDSWICRTGICRTGKWRTKSQGWNNVVQQEQEQT